MGLCEYAGRCDEYQKARVASGADAEKATELILEVCQSAAREFQSCYRTLHFSTKKGGGLVEKV